MKLTRILFILFTGITLCACDKDDSTQPPVKDPWFKGTINNQYYCISRNATFNGFAGWYMHPDFSTHHLVFDREITGTDYIFHMSLSLLKDGERSSHHINEGTYYEGEESCSFTVKRNKEYLATYYPSKAPCDIEVTGNGDYRLNDSGFVIHALTGTINGIFYNTENPKDSLIVKDTEFVIGL